MTHPEYLKTLIEIRNDHLVDYLHSEYFTKELTDENIDNDEFILSVNNLLEDLLMAFDKFDYHGLQARYVAYVNAMSVLSKYTYHMLKLFGDFSNSGLFKGLILDIYAVTYDFMSSSEDSIRSLKASVKELFRLYIYTSGHLQDSRETLDQVISNILKMIDELNMFYQYNHWEDAKFNSVLSDFIELDNESNLSSDQLYDYMTLGIQLVGELHKLYDVANRFPRDNPHNKIIEDKVNDLYLELSKCVVYIMYREGEVYRATI